LKVLSLWSFIDKLSVRFNLKSDNQWLLRNLKKNFLAKIQQTQKRYNTKHYFNQRWWFSVGEKCWCHHNLIITETVVHPTLRKALELIRSNEDQVKGFMRFWLTVVSIYSSALPVNIGQNSSVWVALR
jgi:hypothetical protein